MTARLTATLPARHSVAPRLQSVELPEVPWERSVGAGWEVVLIPQRVARIAVQALDAVWRDLVGAVFAIEGSWGFFVPEESDEPEWPHPARYLRSGTTVTLPPAHWMCAAGSGPGWVRRPEDGRLLTPPLVLHPMVATHNRIWMEPPHQDEPFLHPAAPASAPSDSSSAP